MGKFFKKIWMYILRKIKVIKWVELIAIVKQLVEKLGDDSWTIVFNAVVQAETKGENEGWSGEEKFSYVLEQVKDTLLSRGYTMSMINYLIELAVQVLKTIFKGGN